MIELMVDQEMTTLETALVMTPMYLDEEMVKI